MYAGDMDGSLPPGFRFHPTDEELITYYLNRKFADSAGFSPIAIADVDLNKSEPWDLPSKAKMGEKEWYFFSLRDRKYPTGLRTNRATHSGYWKTTGKDKEVYHSGAQVGMKKTLVFYKGRAPKGEKTNWVMHEYRRQTRVYKPMKEEWVVCRVFRKTNSVKKPQQVMNSSSQPMQLPTELESPCQTISASDMGDIDMSVFNSIVTHASPLNSASTSNYNCAALNCDANDGGGNKVDTNMYMSWLLNNRDGAHQSLLGWPTPTLLGSNYSQNLALLRALQLSTTGLSSSVGELTTTNVMDSSPPPPPPLGQAAGAIW